jgi:hypothetical protein
MLYIRSKEGEERRLKAVRAAKITHGMSNSKIYKTYQKIKERCYNKNSRNYHNYGGRGITICQEWLDDFQVFYDWAMANGYNENAKRGECTIERKDVNGNYCPENCCFVNQSIQSRNTRNQLHEDVGVFLCKCGTWQATITKNYKQIYLGKFKTKEQAIQARKQAKIDYWVNDNPPPKHKALNSTNTSGHKGVSLNKKTGKYEAYSRKSGKQKHLGLFSTISEAVQARDDYENGIN